MPDLISRLSDRRCPDCGTLQPIYVPMRPGSRHSFIRSASTIVPCPGCGLPLRLRDPDVDPHGFLAAVVFTLVLTGGIVGLIPLASRWGWSDTAYGLSIIPIVGGGALIAMGWNILRQRGRELERAFTVPQPPPSQETETPQ